MEHGPFDDVVAALDDAMVVVTAAAGGERAGCLVGFHSQASIHPRRYAVWLSKANHTFRVALLASHLGVHVLDERDRDLAVLFGTETGDDVDKLAGCELDLSLDGVPLLRRCPNRFVVRRTGLLDHGGDHVCFVGEPVASGRGEARVTPLRLAAVSDLEPGHAVDERPTPPTERATG